MSSQEIQLTIVQLDLVESSKDTKIIEQQLGVKGTKLLIEIIREFVDDAFNKIENISNSKYNEIYSLGGDGYRISFQDVNDAYKFVNSFCDNINKHNAAPNNTKRVFRIGAATGKVLYDESKSGLDRIIGHYVLFTVARLVVASKPGWFYIDQKTYKSLNLKDFRKIIVKVKEHDEDIEAWGHPILSGADFLIESFEFQIAIIDAKNNVIKTTTKTIEQKIQSTEFIEKLSNNVNLKMVSIPGKTFQMGTDDKEIERLCKEYNVEYFRREKPQHKVTIQPFFMGKYQVTQAQWRQIANRTELKENRDLTPDPSKFKGDNRPVECVSWEDVVEFCSRLSTYTKRLYRLPSEAEWEYACRAGTTTPFHFGETITTDLANYNGNKIYGNGVKGVYREETTEVGSFGVANNFGLYDMHGNVWEWCQDNWHDNYEGAPTDGSVWIDNEEHNNRRLLRGGSWGSDPVICRSASRYYDYLDYHHDIGFRVVCSGAART